MATAPTVSKPPLSELSTEELMARAANSTKRIAWLQDYIVSWQTARATCLRIARLMNEQVTKDEEAYGQLLGFIALATRKSEQMQDVYQQEYERHERIMSYVIKD